MDATFLPTVGWYNIAGIDVLREARGQGHGQELIRTTLEHARSLGATTVIAAIISRECLEAMRRVFDDGIAVSKEGDFAPEGQDNNLKNPTSAALWYDLA